MRLLSGNTGAGIVSTLQMVPALQSSGGVSNVQENQICFFADFSTFVKTGNFSKTDFHFWRNSKGDPCLCDWLSTLLKRKFKALQKKVAKYSKKHFVQNQQRKQVP